MTSFVLPLSFNFGLKEKKKALDLCTHRLNDSTYISNFCNKFHEIWSHAPANPVSGAQIHFIAENNICARLCEAQKQHGS